MMDGTDYWKIMTINEFTNICGYFNEDTDVNNGYGCDHPDCDDAIIDDDGKMQGRCFIFTCPFGCTVEEDLDEELMEIFEDPKNRTLSTHLWVRKGDDKYCTHCGISKDKPSNDYWRRGNSYAIEKKEEEE